VPRDVIPNLRVSESGQLNGMTACGDSQAQGLCSELGKGK
jgi:hypothetical protein